MHDVTLGSNPPYLLRATMLQESETLGNQVTPTSCAQQWTATPIYETPLLTLGQILFSIAAEGAADEGEGEKALRSKGPPLPTESDFYVFPSDTFFSTRDISNLCSFIGWKILYVSVCQKQMRFIPEPMDKILEIVKHFKKCYDLPSTRQRESLMINYDLSTCTSRSKTLVSLFCSMDRVFFCFTGITGNTGVAVCLRNSLRLSIYHSRL